MPTVEKRTEAYTEDGAWRSPNACYRCDKWFPPYMAGIPQDEADQYCWGHNWAILTGPHHAPTVIGPFHTESLAQDKLRQIGQTGNSIIVEMEHGWP